MLTAALLTAPAANKPNQFNAVLPAGGAIDVDYSVPRAINVEPLMNSKNSGNYGIDSNGHMGYQDAHWFPVRLSDILSYR